MSVFSRFLAFAISAVMVLTVAAGPAAGSVKPLHFLTSNQGPGNIQKVIDSTYGGTPALSAWLSGNPQDWAICDTGFSQCGNETPVQPAETATAYFTCFTAGACTDSYKTALNTGKYNGLSFPGSYKWVLYDLENWSATPTTERNSPVYYMNKFCTNAHNHALKCLLTPAGGVGGGESGYLAADIPQVCGKADAFDINAQGINQGQPAWVSFVQQAAADCRAANASIPVLNGLHSQDGTTNISNTDIYNAFTSTLPYVDGFWLNVDNNPGGFAYMLHTYYG